MKIFGFVVVFIFQTVTLLPLSCRKAFHDMKSLCVYEEKKYNSTEYSKYKKKNYNNMEIKRKHI